jgi:hypothetical protein
MLMLISPKEMPAAVLVSHDLGRYRINDFFPPPASCFSCFVFRKRVK